MGVAQRIAVFTYAIGGHRITVTDCWQCGEVFGVLDATDELRRRNQQPFYCPNGHANIYTGQKSDAVRDVPQVPRSIAKAPLFAGAGDSTGEIFAVDPVDRQPISGPTRV